MSTHTHILFPPFPISLRSAKKGKEEESWGKRGMKNDPTHDREIRRRKERNRQDSFPPGLGTFLFRGLFWQGRETPFFFGFSSHFPVLTTESVGERKPLLYFQKNPYNNIFCGKSPHEALLFRVHPGVRRAVEVPRELWVVHEGAVCAELHRGVDACK